MKPEVNRYVWSLLAVSGLLMPPAIYAQSEPSQEAEMGQVTAKTDSAAEPKQETANGSSEVEHNEENYRRFMELRERDPRTNSMPTNTFQPGSEKLDVLPESSQKHLRNELREVIVEEGEWQEGDENKRYPYVPSAEAETDRELQLQEAEAWDELVGKYQEREAQIHANSARSQAAKKAADADGSQAGGQNGGQPGSDSQQTGSQGQAGASGQSGQELQQNASDSHRSQSQDRAADAAEQARQAEARNAGVSENALEFLMQGQNQGQGQNQEQSLAQEQGQQQTKAQSQGQSPEQRQNQAGQPPNQPSTAETGESGISQNALDFLTQGQADGKSGNQQTEQPSQAQAGQQQSGQKSEPSADQQTAQAQASDQQAAEQSEQQATQQTNEESASEDEEKAEQLAEESTEQQKPEVAVASEPQDINQNSDQQKDDAGTTQNAFEMLSRGTQPSPPADTLSIQELINAQGVSSEATPEDAKGEDVKDQPD